MNRHFLAAPDDAEAENIEQLADRSDLSGIYPEASINCRSDGDRKVKEKKYGIPEKTKHSIYNDGLGIYVGALIPAPIIVAFMLFNYFSQIVNPQNALFILPAIVISILMLFWLFSSIYRKVIEVSGRLGANSLIFPVYLIFCFALYYQPLLMFLYSFDMFWIVNLLVYCLVASGISTAIGVIIIKTIRNDRISKKAKIILLALPIAVCMAANIFAI